jgi:hypothetical protein
VNLAMNISEFPENVLHIIARHLELPFKIRLAMTNKFMFSTLVNTAYSIIIYDPCKSKLDNHGNTTHLGRHAHRNDQVVDYSITLLNDKTIVNFFKTISNPSSLNFNYSDFIIELYLEKLEDISIFNLPLWRLSHNLPVFNNLRHYQFPNELDVYPLTYEHAPNLTSLIIDHNFCDFLDFNKGSIEFFNNEKIKSLYIKGTLGKNEDMVMFKLLTKFPHMIKNLNQLHFLVDSNENYEFVYRRIVGFFAILRKMNLVMHNIHELSLVLTNLSSSTILSLISKHIIFENLIDLSLFIQDDSKILTLVKSLDKLSTIVHHHGFNIKKLLIKYDLLNQDNDKNHLRSMMLLKLCESFHSLTHLNLDLKIDGLNFSNLLMILGTPISNNINTLYDIRINVFQPSENLIGNILPTLEDAILLFPYLNFLNSCGCSVCNLMLLTLSLNDSSNLNLFDETIKVSTLLIIGQELDMIQAECTSAIDSNSIINKYSRYLKIDNYASQGYLVDHLIHKQLNHSLGYLPNLQYFEICGLVYKKFKEKKRSVDAVDEMFMENQNHHYGQFQEKYRLLYGNEFTGLDSSIVLNISDLGQVFNSNLSTFNRI